MMDPLGQKATFRMFVSPENARLWMTSKKLEKLPPWPKRFARQLADLPNKRVEPFSHPFMLEMSPFKATSAYQ